jgi:endonuclease YncB( thermonuclease family)
MIRRILRRFGVTALLLLLGALWLFPEFFGLISEGPTQSASGDKIVVRDGDTLAIGTQDHRLHGIDAPEFSQICQDTKGADWLCGKLARAEMQGLVKGHIISCEGQAHDKFQRVVATCRDETGRDLARTMVERGLAVSFGGFSEGPYASEEADAKATKRGLWQGRFDPPSSWRTGHPRGMPSHRPGEKEKNSPSTR